MAIEQINPIVVTEAQAKAIRKLANLPGNVKYSANEFAAILLNRAICNTFKPVTKNIAETAKKRYEMALAAGFPSPTYKNEEGKDVVLAADEYAKRAATEYRDILTDLES